MYTVIETPLFSKLWPDYWTEDERGEFAAFLSAHPDSGDVISGSAVAARFGGRGRAAENAAVCA